MEEKRFIPSESDVVVLPRTQTETHTPLLSEVSESSSFKA